MTERRVVLSPGDSLVVAVAEMQLPESEKEKQRRIKAESHLRRFGSTHYARINQLRGDDPDADTMLLLDTGTEMKVLVGELDIAGIGDERVIEIMQEYLSGQARRPDPLEISGFSYAYAGFIGKVRESIYAKRSSQTETQTY